jgi:hypothetical protein
MNRSFWSRRSAIASENTRMHAVIPAVKSAV